MKRILIVAGIAYLVAPACLGTYTARLWFKNETTGLDSAGSVAVSRGDLVSCSFSFHEVPPDVTSKWSQLQMFIDIDAPGPNSILTDGDANNWYTAITHYYGDFQAYPVVYAWGPGNGPIHDSGWDCSDSTQPVVTNKGIYALIGAGGGHPPSQNVDNLGFFTFQVGDMALSGAELHWGLEGRVTDSGISTRVMDNRGRTVTASDNWLTVVPEPGIPAAGVALLALVGRMLFKERKSE